MRVIGKHSVCKVVGNEYFLLCGYCRVLDVSKGSNNPCAAFAQETMKENV